jgi:hypothetical protein
MTSESQSLAQTSPLSTSFWLALETVPGGTALPTTWKHHLGQDFDLFKSLFLKPRPDEPAGAVPCPWKCGCFHKVVRAGNGTLHGLCQCALRNCGTYTVLPDEIIPLDLDRPRLAHHLCRAFHLHPKTVKLGLFNTFQIGSWSADAIPVVLTLSASRPEFLNTLAVLIARFGQPFILLGPTNRHLDQTGKELLASTGAAFFALQDNLALPPSCSALDSGLRTVDCGLRTEDCGLRTLDSGLFSSVVALAPTPSDEDLARRTFLALQEHDQSRRRRPPSLYTIFQLYCLKELTIPQIARKCRCSIGTVANRLKLLRAKTGVSADQLRRVSPHFTQFQDDLRQAQRNHHRSTRYHS